MHSPIAATALLEPIPRQPTPPKAAVRFAARAFCARLRLPTRTVRKPQEVVILVTIEACLMVDTDNRQWAGTLVTTGTERTARSPAGRMSLYRRRHRSMRLLFCDGASR